MTKSLKVVALGIGIGLATATMAQPAQQPQYQTQMPMNQAMTQTRPMMMNNPEMRAQMAQMRQGCERMMSQMGNRMPQPGSNRR